MITENDLDFTTKSKRGRTKKVESKKNQLPIFSANEIEQNIQRSIRNIKSMGFVFLDYNEKRVFKSVSQLMGALELENRNQGKITLEPVSEKDKEFLEWLYFSTRENEFAMLNWSREQLAAFLKMQHEFQKNSYAMQFPGAEHSIINCAGFSVGRLMIYRTEKENRLVDISILPEFRNRGIGGKIIADLLAESADTEKKVSLQVLKTNEKAFRLYKKMGFSVTEENDTYFSMEN